ncbi:unnamed protein product [Boreogadus saida]
MDDERLVVERGRRAASVVLGACFDARKMRAVPLRRRWVKAFTPGFHRTRHGSVTAAARLGRDFACLHFHRERYGSAAAAVFTRDHEIPR